MDLSLGSSFTPFMSGSVSCKLPRLAPMKVPVSCRASSSTQTASGVRELTKNFYNILSLSPESATSSDIKLAYRSMALKYHPDVCHPSMKQVSTQMFVQLNEAYKTLSNPSLREEYDSELSLRDDMVSRLSLSEEGVELKRRTGSRLARKQGSSSSRMRSRNKGRN